MDATSASLLTSRAKESTAVSCAASRGRSAVMKRVIGERPPLPGIGCRADRGRLHQYRQPRGPRDLLRQAELPLPSRPTPTPRPLPPVEPIRPSVGKEPARPDNGTTKGLRENYLRVVWGAGEGLAAIS